MRLKGLAHVSVCRLLAQWAVKSSISRFQALTCIIAFPGTPAVSLLISRLRPYIVPLPKICSGCRFDHTPSFLSTISSTPLSLPGTCMVVP